MNLTALRVGVYTLTCLYTSWPRNCLTVWCVHICCSSWCLKYIILCFKCWVHVPSCVHQLVYFSSSSASLECSCEYSILSVWCFWLVTGTDASNSSFQCFKTFQQTLGSPSTSFRCVMSQLIKPKMVVHSPLCLPHFTPMFTRLI